MGSALLQSIINGVLMGAFYSLIGMGLNCVYSVMSIINFCQGDFLMVGMYISYFLLVLFGVDPYLSIPIVAAVMFLFGMVMQHFLVTPMLKQKSNHLNMVFLTIGVGMLLQNMAQIFFTSDYRTIDTPYSQATIQFGNIYINTSKTISFLFGIVLTVALFLFFKNTTLGKRIRATSQNSTGAQLVGIRINWIYMFTFSMGAAIAGVTGSLLLPFYYAYPTVGGVFGTRSFAVVMLGGLGNIRGAFIAGILLGILETVSSLFLGSSYKDTVVCVAFLAVLIIRQKIHERKAR